MKIRKLTSISVVVAIQLISSCACVKGTRDSSSQRSPGQVGEDLQKNEPRPEKPADLETPKKPQVRTLSQKVIVKGQYWQGLEKEFETFVLKNSADIPASLSDHKDLANQDWEASAIVGVVASVPSSGYEIVIDRVEEVNGKLEVYWDLKTPEPGSINATVMSQPHMFVSVQIIPKDIQSFGFTRLDSN